MPSRHPADDPDFWLEHIRFGVRVTWGSVIAAGGYILLATDVSRPVLLVLMGLVALANLGTMRLPWSRMLRAPRALLWFYGWTFSVILVITVGAWVDGGVGSPVVLLYVVPALFAAIAYPPRAVQVLTTLMVVSVAVMAVVGPHDDTAGAWLTVSVLALAAWTFTHAAENYRQAHARTHRLAEQLAAQAHTDSLTGCLNHRAFQEVLAGEVARAQRTGRSLGLVLADVDHFKAVNDEHGHRVGDIVLERVAATLRANVREGDTVARIGGEEFAVLLPDCHDGHHLAAAERLRVAVGAQHDPVRVTMSFGLAVLPDMVDTGEALLAHADLGLYAAKAAGRDAVVVHGDSRTGAAAAGAVAGRVSELLAGDQLTAHFQPIVDLRTGAVVAYEALARIRDSQLRPDQWLALAEESGQRVQLEVAMLDTALATWPHVPPDVVGAPRLFVNLSPDVLASGAVWSRLHALADRRVVIEVSERSPVLNYEALRQTTADLAAAGIDLAVDDVGAGHANMRHVLELRPAFIKLDRSLVARVDGHSVQASLVRALATFARDNGVVIIAEGIERPAEARLCAELGAGLGQGYLIARPGPGLPEPRWQPLAAGLT